MKKRSLLFTIVVGFIAGIHGRALADPFTNRNRNICENFDLTHQASIQDVVSLPGNLTLSILDVREPYFSWLPLVLVYADNEAPWGHISTGQKVSLSMRHTTSDVPQNAVIEEGFHHAFTGSGKIRFMGFLSHPVDSVKALTIEQVTDIGEVGPYTLTYLVIQWSNQQTQKVLIPQPINTQTVAQPGDKIILTLSFYMHDHVYQPNPYGNKRVIQKHWVTPFSHEPVYRMPSFGSAIYNLSRGTVYRF